MFATELLTSTLAAILCGALSYYLGSSALTVVSVYVISGIVGFLAVATLLGARQPIDDSDIETELTALMNTLDATPHRGSPGSGSLTEA